MRNYLVGWAIVLLFLPGSAHAALVNINTADAALLDTLPGIGPTKAAAIIDYRTQHGPFARIEDVQEVKGIGPATYAELQSRITITGGESSVTPKPVSPKVQPALVDTSSSKSTNLTEAAHAGEAVDAPGAASDLVAPGAPVVTTASAGILESPWTLAFLGLLVLAGGALLVL